MSSEELFGDPDQWPDSDLVAVSGVLAPGLVLAAVAEGVFPMPLDGDEVPEHLRGGVGWWSPLQRGVIPLDRLRVTRSLRASTRHRLTTVDADFEQVIDRCADPDRPLGWITPAVRRTYLDLHRSGDAHSVETWDDQGRLVGGLYGVSVGGLFCGESMFHDPQWGRDASKTALVRLVCELVGPGTRLLDVQWVTPHLASLGATSLPREDYLRALDEATASPPPPWRAEAVSGRDLLARLDAAGAGRPGPGPR